MASARFVFVFFALTPALIYAIITAYGGFMTNTLHVVNPFEQYLGVSTGGAIFAFLISVFASVTGLVAGRAMYSGSSRNSDRYLRRKQELIQQYPPSEYAQPPVASGYAVASPEDLRRFAYQRQPKPRPQSFSPSSSPSPSPKLRPYQPSIVASPPATAAVVQKEIDFSTTPPSMVEDLEKFGIASVESWDPDRRNVAVLRMLDGSPKIAAFVMSSANSKFWDYPDVDLVCIFVSDGKLKLKAVQEVVR